MVKRAHRLQGRLELKVFGDAKTARRLKYVVLRLGDALQKKLVRPGHSRLRIEGELQGHPVALALQPERGANHYVMIGPKIMAAVGALVGDRVTLAFDIADASHVHMPAELVAELGADPETKTKWERLTPGRRRTWSVYVDRPKGPDARRAKAREVIDRVRRGLVNPRDAWP